MWQNSANIFNVMGAGDVGAMPSVGINGFDGSGQGQDGCGSPAQVQEPVKETAKAKKWSKSGWVDQSQTWPNQGQWVDMKDWEGWGDDSAKSDWDDWDGWDDWKAMFGQMAGMMFNDASWFGAPTGTPSSASASSMSMQGAAPQAAPKTSPAGDGGLSSSSGSSARALAEQMWPEQAEQAKPASSDEASKPEAPTADVECGTESGQEKCRFFMKAGFCKFGSACRYEHDAASVQPAAALPFQLNSQGMPLRPGEPYCAHFLKHNECKFGQECRLHHPEGLGGMGPLPGMGDGALLNEEKLPLRPGKELCPFFEKAGACHFGPACRFDHSPEALLAAAAEKKKKPDAEAGKKRKNVGMGGTKSKRPAGFTYQMHH